MRFKITVFVAVLGSLVAACDTTDDFTDEEWAKIKALEPLAGTPPRNPYNHRDQDELIAKLGQMLFFDKEVAEGITVEGPSGKVGDLRKVACVNCHSSKMFHDPTLMSNTPPGALGNNGAVPGLPHGRNWLTSQSGQMVNLHWYEWTLSSGRFDSMVEHGVGVWGTSATVMAQARFLYAKYKDEWNAAFPDNQLDPRLGLPTTDPANVFPATGNPAAIGAAPGAFELMPIDAQNHIHQMRANLGRLFDTYPRMLTTPDSPFQRYVRDRDFNALSGAAKRGLKLFIGKAACSDCHNGPTLSDNKFHNIGAPNVIFTPNPMMPNGVQPVALSRGRAPSVEAVRLSLTQLDDDPDAPIFNGAGRFSDNRTLGKDRLEVLRQLDLEHCLCRRADKVVDAAACTAAIIASETQKALRTAETLDCLKFDDMDPSMCVCRMIPEADAVTTVDACTSVTLQSPSQVALRGASRVSCVKYDDTLEGQFRTPSILNTAEAAPYFHGGLTKTLEDVLWFYNQGGGPEGTFVGRKSPELRPLGLTESELQDLAAFLRSLTGKSPAEVAAEAKVADPDAWDWSKNTAKPPIFGTGGTMGTGGSTGAGGRGGGGGATGTGGSSATGTGGSSASGTGGAGGATGAAGATGAGGATGTGGAAGATGTGGSS
jgi:cytochrome c peroxidase